MLSSRAVRTRIRGRLSANDREEMFPTDLVNIGHTLEVATILSDLSKLTTTLWKCLQKKRGQIDPSASLRGPWVGSIYCAVQPHFATDTIFARCFHLGASDRGESLLSSPHALQGFQINHSRLNGRSIAIFIRKAYTAF